MCAAQQVFPAECVWKNWPEVRCPNNTLKSTNTLLCSVNSCYAIELSCLHAPTRTQWSHLSVIKFLIDKNKRHKTILKHPVQLCYLNLWSFYGHGIFLFDKATIFFLFCFTIAYWGLFHIYENFCVYGNYFYE